ncbi:hypothetical protein BQ8420_14045 [Nocardiopsis sp. JB363]|nr:hypothetical protein BQ8420_14045 [Nocardiopsis sp. JB363]
MCLGHGLRPGHHHEQRRHDGGYRQSPQHQGSPPHHWEPPRRRPDGQNARKLRGPCHLSRALENPPGPQPATARRPACAEPDNVARARTNGSPIDERHHPWHRGVGRGGDVSGQGEAGGR